MIDTPPSSCKCVRQPLEIYHTDSKTGICMLCGHAMIEHYSGVCWHGDSMLWWQKEQHSRND